MASTTVDGLERMDCPDKRLASVWIELLESEENADTSLGSGVRLSDELCKSVSWCDIWRTGLAAFVETVAARSPVLLGGSLTGTPGCSKPTRFLGKVMAPPEFTADCRVTSADTALARWTRSRAAFSSGGEGMGPRWEFDAGPKARTRVKLARSSDDEGSSRAVSNDSMGEPMCADLGARAEGRRACGRTTGPGGVTSGVGRGRCVGGVATERLTCCEAAP